MLVAHSSPAPAATQSGSLVRTRQQVSEIRKRLAAAQGRVDAIKKEVGRLDALMDILDKQIAGGQRDVSRLESEIRTAQAQITQLQGRYDKAIDVSNERARRVYMAGPSQTVAALFAARSVADLARAQVFMEKSAEQDSKTIIDTSRLKKDVEEKQRALESVKATLDSRRLQLQQRRELAAGAMKDRNEALAVAEKEIADSRRHLEALEADSQRLTQVLRSSASQQVPRNGASPGGDISGEGGAASTSGYVRPVSGRVTSPFGPRWGRMHSGVDIDGNTGDPIRATKAGTVMGVACGGGYGICTIIDHGDGVTSLYAHMSRKVVSSGRVQAGQLIGNVGCSGSCTGSHIHFEIRVNGNPQNPLRYF